MTGTALTGMAINESEEVVTMFLKYVVSSNKGYSVYDWEVLS
jgi:hypothetical protein